MKKKTILLLLILTGILPIACCPEAPSGPYKLGLRQISLYSQSYITEANPTYPDYIVDPNDTYIEDTLILRLDFATALVQNTDYFSFQSSAYAWSCDNNDYPNYTTLHDKIEEITVTSNQQFNDVKAGESLNSKVISFSNDFKSHITLVELASTINSIDGAEFAYKRNKFLTTLATIEKPASAAVRTFTVTITYKSGKQEMATSHPIIW